MRDRRPSRRLVERLILALASGALFACAYPPVAVPWLSAPAVAGFCLLAWSGSWRRGALLGATFGVGFLGVLLWWLWASIGPGAWVALTVVEAGWFALLGAAVAAIRASRLAWAWTALLWTATEVLRSSWPWGGLPWGRLGFSALDTPWQGWLALAGVTGTTFVLAAIGAVTARAITSPDRVRVGTATLVISASAVAGASPPPAIDGIARVAVVQGGVPGDGTRLVDHHREVTASHARETAALAAELRVAGQPVPDLVLWPENATAVDPMSDQQARSAIRDAARDAGAPLLAGSIVDGPGADRALNQGIVWSSEGVPAERYTKRHLVPFGEYVPWRSVASRVSQRVAQEIPRDMVPGTVGDPLDIGGLLVADALCFDVAYDDVIAPQVRRGAELVTVQTSNAMFLGTSQLDQQWSISRARAIESGRSVVVASVNGVSGAIGPDGAVLARLPVQVAGSAVVEVALARTITPAVRWGPWPGRLAVGLGLLVLIGAGSARFRSPSTILVSRYPSGRKQ